MQFNPTIDNTISTIGIIFSSTIGGATKSTIQRTNNSTIKGTLILNVRVVIMESSHILTTHDDAKGLNIMLLGGQTFFSIGRMGGWIEEITLALLVWNEGDGTLSYNLITNEATLSSNIWLWYMGGILNRATYKGDDRW